VLTGEVEGEAPAPSEVVPELAFDHPHNVAAQRQAFFGAPADEGQLLAELEAQAVRLEEAILGWVAREAVECLLAENASALPFHLTLGMALERVYRRGAVSAVVTHDHDLPWERGERYASPYAGVRELVARCFPVALPGVRHAVINSAAREALATRLGITEGVTVVPNVMDFDRPFGQPDAYNADLRRELGLGDDRLLLAQVTRIVRRKGIETAVELVARLDDPRLALVITGTERDDDSGYYRELQELVAARGLERQVLFAGERFGNGRGVDAAGSKIYALPDAYAHATACTYFSTYEGFGNAFVEAVVARQPVFVNNYEPVYWPDIGSRGFDTVMIEGGLLTFDAVDQVRRVLDDPGRRREMVEHNHALGREHFSFQALQALLEGIFGG
jgi:glycosyltransferase involved in cell wall biosynthesis